MNTSWRQLLDTALARTRSLLTIRPGFRPLLSVERQLEYLIAVDTGQQAPDRLNEINLGLVAVREIEGWDDELADMLHQISARTRTLATVVALRAAD